MDTNGAGDTFATAYMLALAARSLSPGATANWAASRAVTQPQSCKPGCIEAAIKRDSYAARFGTWMRMQVCSALLQLTRWWREQGFSVWSICHLKGCLMDLSSSMRLKGIERSSTLQTVS